MIYWFVADLRRVNYLQALTILLGYNIYRRPFFRTNMASSGYRFNILGQWLVLRKKSTG